MPGLLYMLTGNRNIDGLRAVEPVLLPRRGKGIARLTGETNVARGVSDSP